MKREATARMLNACAFALRARAELLAVGHVNMAGLAGEMAVASWELVGREPQYAPKTEELHKEMGLYYRMRAAAHEAMAGQDVWLTELNRAVQELEEKLEMEVEVETMELIEGEVTGETTTAAMSPDLVSAHEISDPSAVILQGTSCNEPCAPVMVSVKSKYRILKSGIAPPPNEQK